MSTKKQSSVDFLHSSLNDKLNELIKDCLDQADVFFKQGREVSSIASGAMAHAYGVVLTEVQNNMISQARAIHKEEIIKAHGVKYFNVQEVTGEDYYNETFQTNTEDEKP